MYSPAMLTYLTPTSCAPGYSSFVKQRDEPRAFSLNAASSSPTRFSITRPNGYASADACGVPKVMSVLTYFAPL